MNQIPVFGILIALFACDFNPDAKIPIAAANTLEQHYMKQKLQIHAAGNDCLILLIRAEAVLNDATVESIHYGTGEYNSYDGGVQQYAEDRRFRAVAYRDADGRFWTYGAITRDEAKSMPICR